MYEYESDADALLREAMDLYSRAFLKGEQKTFPEAIVESILDRKVSELLALLPVKISES